MTEKYTHIVNIITSTEYIPLYIMGILFVLVGACNIKPIFKLVIGWNPHLHGIKNQTFRIVFIILGLLLLCTPLEEII